MHTPTRVVTKWAMLAGLLATAIVAPTFAASSPADNPDVKTQIDLFGGDPRVLPPPRFHGRGSLPAPRFRAK